MGYQDEDKDFINYDVYNFGEFTLRGPQPDLNKPYICYIGAAQTFGRFCSDPFANIVAQHFNLGSLNFGIGGADPVLFLNPQIIEHANKAKFVVIQVMSARSSSNSQFKNKTGRREGYFNNRFDVVDEFWEEKVKSYNLFFSNKHELIRLVEETRENYINNMTNILNSITSKKILLWVSTRQPEYKQRYLSYEKLSGEFPHFVNKEMIDNIKRLSDIYIECQSKSGMPHIVTENVTNYYYPSPQLHKIASDMLIGVLQNA